MFPVTLAAAVLAACTQSSVTKKSELRAAGIASYGLASFYRGEQQTANGEKFNPNDPGACDERRYWAVGNG